MRRCMSDISFAQISGSSHMDMQSRNTISERRRWNTAELLSGYMRLKEVKRCKEKISYIDLYISNVSRNFKKLILGHGLKLKSCIKNARFHEATIKTSKKFNDYSSFPEALETRFACTCDSPIVRPLDQKRFVSLTDAFINIRTSILNKIAFQVRWLLAEGIRLSQ